MRSLFGAGRVAAGAEANMGEQVDYEPFVADIIGAIRGVAPLARGITVPGCPQLFL
ncbi:MAG TPA: hypothetical protein VFT87_04285 [Candidatus Saccharimonadales bacterium]|nr:hypothetical protein [Candidatus Saccharimonadales bacterium]